jgi:hypothetical protein
MEQFFHHISAHSLLQQVSSASKVQNNWLINQLMEAKDLLFHLHEDVSL